MEFKYEIKGITLDEFDMQRIKEYYERRCTAQYLAENYGFDEERAMELGCLVREKMFKYDFTENEAIDEVFEEEGITPYNGYVEIAFFEGDEGDIDAEDYVQENNIEEDFEIEWDDYRKGYSLRVPKEN